MTRERVVRPTQPIQQLQSSSHSVLRRSSWGTDSRERSSQEPVPQSSQAPTFDYDFTQIPVTASPPPAISSGGINMRPDLRVKMESAFNADFTDVKLHINSSSASAVGAIAYTQGQHIHFAPGRFHPENQTGQKLLGHELAHVLQQRTGRLQPTAQINGLPVNQDSALEREADQISSQLSSQMPVTKTPATLGNSQGASAIAVAQFFGGIFGFERHQPADAISGTADKQSGIEKLINQIKEEERNKKKELEAEKNKVIEEIDDKYKKPAEQTKQLGTQIATLRESIAKNNSLKNQLWDKANGLQEQIDQLTETIKTTIGKKRDAFKQRDKDSLQRKINSFNEKKDELIEQKNAILAKINRGNGIIQNQWDAIKQMELEIKKLEPELEERDKERRRYLRFTYVPALQEIGISPEKLAARLPKEIIFKQENDDTYHLLWNSKVIFKVFTGENAFEATDTGEKNLERQVYTKKGTNKQYVKDDRETGVFTRRYAFAEKSKEQAEKLNKEQKLAGRTSQYIYKKNPNLTNEFEFLADKDEPMSVPEMLFIHQELGSGDEQRGVSISSTDKLLHGNSGDPFRTVGGSTFKIDLAKVPVDKKNPYLFNLYSQQAQTQTIGLERFRFNQETNKYETAFTAEEMKEHTDDSTKKNRELYLRELDLKAVEKETKH